MKAISVDPGRNGGCAHWEEDFGAPTRTTVWAPAKDLPWELAILVMGRTLVREVAYGPAIMWCEWPTLHESSEAGRETARSGALVKLAASIGVAIEVCRSHDIKFVPVPVADWKGQMSKVAVENRIRRILGPDACSNFRTHAWDAVGIGLHMKGRFKTWQRP